MNVFHLVRLGKIDGYQRIDERQFIFEKAFAILAYSFLAAAVLGPFTRGWREVALAGLYLNLFVLIFIWGVWEINEQMLLFFDIWGLAILFVVLVVFGGIWLKNRLRTMTYVVAGDRLPDHLPATFPLPRSLFR
ncbi:MAG: hypothetical protein ABH950_06590 [Candidatus Altiarchaeota archaeon]